MSEIAVLILTDLLLSPRGAGRNFIIMIKSKQSR